MRSAAESPIPLTNDGIGSLKHVDSVECKRVTKNTKLIPKKLTNHHKQINDEKYSISKEMVVT